MLARTNRRGADLGRRGVAVVRRGVLAGTDRDPGDRGGGAGVVFGACTVASKGAMDHVPPLTLVWARFGLAALALAWLCRRRGRRPEFSRRSALFGALGIALVYACQNLGL